MAKNEAYSIIKETVICHPGTPNGILAIITIGEVNGIIEVHNESWLPGSDAAIMPNTMPRIMGITTTPVSYTHLR